MPRRAQQPLPWSTRFRWDREPIIRLIEIFQYGTVFCAAPFQLELLLPPRDLPTHIGQRASFAVFAYMDAAFVTDGAVILVQQLTMGDILA